MVSAPDVRTPGDELHSFPDLVAFLAPFVLFALIIVLFGLSRMRIGYFYAKKNVTAVIKKDIPKNYYTVCDENEIHIDEKCSAMTKTLKSLRLALQECGEWDIGQEARVVHLLVQQLHKWSRPRGRDIQVFISLSLRIVMR